MGEYCADWDEASHMAILKAIDKINGSDDIHDLFDYYDCVDVLLIGKTQYYKTQTHHLLHAGLKGTCLFCMEGGYVSIDICDYLRLRRHREIFCPTYMETPDQPGSYAVYQCASCVEYLTQKDKFGLDFSIEDLDDMVD